MPDGDKFERRLIGKGWKKAYRVACRNDDFPELIRLLSNAKDDALRNGLDCPILNEISNTAYEALDQPLFASASPVQVQHQFSQQLDALVASQLSSPGTRLADEAARAVYAELVSGGQSVTREQIKQQINKKFEERVLDNQFLSKVREGVMKETGRSFEAQVTWEKRVTDCC